MARFSTAASGIATKWKRPRVVALPHRIDAGRHMLQVSVSNMASHPCLSAHCDKLGVRTGPSWDASALSEPFQPAVSVSRLRLPDVAREYPSASESFRAIAPWLALIFLRVVRVDALEQSYPRALGQSNTLAIDSQPRALGAIGRLGCAGPQQPVAPAPGHGVRYPTTL